MKAACNRLTAASRRRKSQSFRPTFEQLEARELLTAAPLAPVFTTTAASPTQVNIAWSKVSGATGYILDEWNGSSWSQLAKVGSSVTAEKVTGLTAGTTYYFDLAAYNTVGTTWANYETVTTLVAKPAAPTLTATAASGNQVNLSWNSVAGATNYVIDEKVNGVFTQIGTTTSTSVSVTGLNPSTAYSFEVGASNSAGTTWSAAKSVTTLKTVAPPAAPTLTATVISSSQVNLSWNSASGATSYLIDEWNGSAWVQIASTSGTSYAVTGLSASTTYYFEVGASNSAGTGWSSDATVTTLASTTVAPAAPTLTATAVSSSQVNLSWNSVSGATSYAIDEWNGSAWVQIGSVSASTTSFSVTGLSASTTYYFEVGASNSAGTSWSSYQTVATLSGGGTTIDHPAAAYGYTNVSGSLFGANGPVFTDVQQGAEGDCWFLSSLAEVAARNPSDIQNMFTADGTTVENGVTVSLYYVRLYDSSGTAHEILVDTELPDGGEYYDRVSNGVLWVALAEKAYAQANGLGYVTTQNIGTDSYDAMDGGDPAWALQAITGNAASDYNINPSSMVSAWNAGQLICICTGASTSSSYIVPDHCYAVVGYNSSNGEFEVYNPWGVDSSGVWAQGTYNGQEVYGLYWATGSFLSANYVDQAFGVGAEDGTHGNPMSPVQNLALHALNLNTPASTDSHANNAQNAELLDDTGFMAAVHSAASGFAMNHSDAARDAFWANGAVFEDAA